MTAQYLRNCSLIVANESGAGIELGSLRVVFEVHRGDLLTPNSCDVRVYNLNDQTAETLRKPEFTQLQLKVGYQGQQLQLLFKGSIKQVRKGREDQKNSYLAFTAADADEAYNFSAMALTLAAGATPQDAIQSIIASMAGANGGSPTASSDSAPPPSPTGGTPDPDSAPEPTGQTVSLGYIPPSLTKSKLPRGRTYYGACKDELRELAAANGCTASIQDGKAQFVPLTSYIPGEAVVVSPYTGLINVPEQTQNGLTMRVLLNPAVKIGQLVKLDSKDVNQFRYGLDSQSQVLNTLLADSTTKLNADGLYYAMRIDHSGDTRGTPWYSDLTCLAVDASAPVTTAPATPSASPFPTPQDAIKQY